jgi:hypothetical protein
LLHKFLEWQKKEIRIKKQRLCGGGGGGGVVVLVSGSPAAFLPIAVQDHLGRTWDEMESSRS